MRRLLAALMMIVMLTPSLACAMPLCAPAAKTMPCHEQVQTQSADAHGQDMPAGKLMLVKDCAGIDLQTVQATAIDAPDFTFVAAIFAPATTLADAQVLRETARITTGPPPLSDDATPRAFSLVLNERLLI